MRQILADHIEQIGGKIKIHDDQGNLITCDAYNALDENLQAIPDTMKFQIMRGMPEVTLSVSAFKTNLVEGITINNSTFKIYGGDEIIAAFVDYYQIAVARHSMLTNEPEFFNVGRPLDLDSCYHVLYRCVNGVTVCMCVCDYASQAIQSGKKCGR